MDAQWIKNLQETHIAAWNEKDRAKRDSLIATIYADDMKMYDKDFVLHGSSEVSGFIDKVLADPKFDFTVTKPLELTQNGARLFWHIQTSEGVLTGMDFFIIENKKVTQLYVFMDTHP
jgi:hypothetical protein